MSTLSDITTHTRASSATYTDANGILQTAAINEPRTGHHLYNGTAWVDEGYLHESEARTNLVTYSEDLVALGVSTRDTTNTSDSFTATAQAGVQTPNIFFNTTLGTGVHTWWVDFTDLVKAPYVVLQTTLFNATANGSSIFDLANQSVVFQSGNHTARIVEVADGVYRCIITLATDGTDNTGRLVIGLSENTTILRITDPDGTESVKVLRQQLEADSTPSSYIPTSGATVTRAAETLTVPSANLPWPEPVVIGPELVPDPSFDDPLVWVASGAITVTGGQAVFNSAGNNSYVYDFMTIPANTVCKIEVVVSSHSAGDIKVRMPGSNDSELNLSGPGTYSTVLTGTVVNERIWLIAVGTTTATIDSISVREINPLAVSIQMEGTMTYADSGASVELVQLDWRAGTTEFIRYAIETTGSRTGQQDFYQREPVSGQDTVSSSNLYYSPGINVPFNISSRHGSTFVNGAVDGVALTANTTPTALPDLSATDMDIGSDFMGTIKLFRVWADDLTDVGIEEASA